METKDFLSYISNVIHTTIVATVDDEGLPVTAAIDMMDCDENSLYFLTAKGKGFYDRLIKRGFLALNAMKGKDNRVKTIAIYVCKLPCRLPFCESAPLKPEDQTS